MTQVPAPSPVPPDLVWVEDNLPDGAVPSGTWIWDPAQKASGSQSHTEPGASGVHEHRFDLDPDIDFGLSLSETDKLVTYVLIDPCDPPQEIMLQWKDGNEGWEHRAFWGEDLIALGTAGTPSRADMGALPPSGVWARLEVPASSVGRDGRNVWGMAFTLYDGHAWFDRAGKATATGSPLLSGLSLSPVSVVAGSSATGTVTLSGPAPTGGLIIGLSAGSSIAAVPDSVTVNSGESSATFQITTSLVPSDSSVTIWAYDDDDDDFDANLTVLKGSPPLSGLSLSPTSVIGGSSSTGTVTLAFAALAGGSDVALSSDSAAATVPASVSVPAGAISATFPVTTAPVPADVTAMVSASLAGVTKTASITIQSAYLASMTLSPTSVDAGESSQGSLTLTGPAPPGGAVVSLSSSYPSVATVPATVTIDAGGISAPFTVTTSAVIADTTVTITANYRQIKTKTLTVRALPPALASVTVAPRSIASGTSVSGNVSLTTEAGAGGVIVALASSDTSVVTVPASTTVPEGSLTFGHFSVTAGSVSLETPVTIRATYLGVTRTVDVTVVPSGFSAHLDLSGLRVLVGYPITGTITLNSPAPVGGLTVYLDGGPLLTMPGTVTIAEGSKVASFTIAAASAVETMESDSIDIGFASYVGVVPLEIAPVLEVTPGSVNGGNPATGRVYLPSPAPPGGVTFNLVSSDPAVALVPAIVVVAEGESSHTFPIITFGVTETVSVALTASSAVVTGTANLIVRPAFVGGFDADRGRVLRGYRLPGISLTPG